MKIINPRYRSALANNKKRDQIFLSSIRALVMQEMVIKCQYHYLFFQLMKLLQFRKAIGRFREGHRSTREANKKFKNPAFLELYFLSYILLIYIYQYFFQLFNFSTFFYIFFLKKFRTLELDKVIMYFFIFIYL